MKKTFFLSILTLIGLTIISCLLLINSKFFLKKFDIKNVYNEGNKVYVSVENLKAAKKYQLLVEDENEISLYNAYYDSNNIDFIFNNMEYNKKYYFRVIAFDQDGKSRECNDEYVFTYLDASIYKDNNVILDNKNYSIYVDGDDITNYNIKVYVNNELKIEEPLTDNSYSINKDLYLDMEAIVKIELYKNKILIDSYNLYNNINPITDVSISHPVENMVYDYQDIPLTFTGGDNAILYTASIYDETDFLIKSVDIKKKHVIISKKLFASGTYKIVVRASLGDYYKESTAIFTIDGTEKCEPTYINIAPNSIKMGDKIELKTTTSDASIYYTLDGSDPSTESSLYTEAIEVTGPITIKTIVISPNLQNSVIREYNINPSDNKKITVYISASNIRNVSVSESKFTTEDREMKDISDYIGKRLTKYGVNVITNDQYKDISSWVNESNECADLYVALHTSNSTNHDTTGLETWVNNNDTMYDVGNFIHAYLSDIYPYDNKNFIKANGVIPEIDENNKHGVYLSLGYIDVLEDSKWIYENKKEIGNKIADAILAYYNIKTTK